MSLFQGRLVRPAVQRYSLFDGVPVRYAADGDERWITLGGSAKDGKSHVGGFPAKIDGEGNIVASRVGGLQGKNVKDVKGHFDEVRGKGAEGKKGSEGKGEGGKKDDKAGGDFEAGERRWHVTHRGSDIASSGFAS